MRIPNYDIVIHRTTTEESFGYMCMWGDEGTPPISIESVPPDIPVSTSTGVVVPGGPFSARDAAPPYPIEICNWQDGAGQMSYDTAKASAEAYRTSWSMDVTQEGHIEIGPRMLEFSEGRMRNVVSEGLGTFWVGLEPESNGGTPPQYRQVAYMVRYKLRPLPSSEVPESGEANIDFYNWTTGDYQSRDLSRDVYIRPLDGDYLYCPKHNEVFIAHEVTESHPDYYITVGRGRANTTPTAHSRCGVLYGFGWRIVPFSTSPHNPPSWRVRAFASDGRFMYAAMTNLAGNNGEVWRGNTEGDWVRWANANNIVALQPCGGYMYGAQDLYNNVSRVGWFDTAASNEFKPISLAGGVPYGVRTAGLVAVGNHVYWTVTDGSRAWVYRAQHTAAGDSFELVAQLPAGFTATCSLSHLGNFYVGGYMDTLDTIAGDTGWPRYEGVMYVVSQEGEATIVARIRNTPENNSAIDSRIRGLCSIGPYILMLTTMDTFVYDPQHGGWSHYSDTSTAIALEKTEPRSWPDDTAYPGFLWTSAKQPNAVNALITKWAGWDTNGDGFVDDGIVKREDKDDKIGFTATQVLDTYRYKVDAAQWRRWYIDDITPTSHGTIVATVDGLQSQAGAIVMSDGEKECRVHLWGVVSGSQVVNYRVGLGYMDNVSGAQNEYKYKWSGLLPTKKFTFTLTLGPTGASLYVGDAKVATVARNKLRNNTTKTIWWSVGWPRDVRWDTNDEKIRYVSLYYTAAGEYTPDYQVQSTVLTEVGQIANANGVTVVPMPGVGWDYINVKEIAPVASLETSDSAFHMGSVEKYFVSAVVEHSPLQLGQSITVTPIVDDVAVGATTRANEEAGDPDSEATTTTALITAKGKKVRVMVTLRDNDHDRPYVLRLRVFRITVKFFPVNSPHVHTYHLNCREGVQCRNGRDWGHDPEAAIRHLFAAADSGEVVIIESLFTQDKPNGMQLARIESVRLLQGPGDMVNYNRLTGTCAVRLRRVDSPEATSLIAP